MIADILVGYTPSRFSQVAFEHALDLAEKCGARIRLLGAIEDTEPEDETGLVGASSPDLLDYVETPGGEPSETDPPAGIPPYMEEARLRCVQAHVACSVRRLHGEANRRLREQSRLAQLLVIGRHGRRVVGVRPHLGRTIRGLLASLPIPLMVGHETYRELARLLLVYTPTLVGGRTLNMAAQIATTVNGTLDIITPGATRRAAQRTLAEAEFARLPYHLDGAGDYIEGDVVEALLRAGMERQYDLVAVPAPPPRWWTPDPGEAVKVALELPDVVTLIVP